MATVARVQCPSEKRSPRTGAGAGLGVRRRTGQRGLGYRKARPLPSRVERLHNPPPLACLGVGNFPSLAEKLRKLKRHALIVRVRDKPCEQLGRAIRFVVGDRVRRAWECDDDFIVSHLAMERPARHSVTVQQKGRRPKPTPLRANRSTAPRCGWLVALAIFPTHQQ